MTGSDSGSRGAGCKLRFSFKGMAWRGGYWRGGKRRGMGGEHGTDM